MLLRSNSPKIQKAFFILAGNMSSATIPVLLDGCNRNGIIKHGIRPVLSGFGAGLTYGATLMTF